MFDRFQGLIPMPVLSESGSVSYSGRTAFSNPSRLYILGLNPGGCPIKQATETVKWHTKKVADQERADWSAYRDERWNNNPPGTHGMQPSTTAQPDSIKAHITKTCDNMDSWEGLP